MRFLIISIKDEQKNSYLAQKPNEALDAWFAGRGAFVGAKFDKVRII